MKQTQKSIPASFKGHAQIINGSELVTTGLRGTIGKDHFTGSGTGTREWDTIRGRERLPEQRQGDHSAQPRRRLCRQGKKVHKAGSFGRCRRRQRKIRFVRRHPWVLDVMEYARQAERVGELFRILQRLMRRLW